MQLVKALDGETVLAETRFAWQFGRTYTLDLQVSGSQIVATMDGQVVIEYHNQDNPLAGGGVAFICEEGRFGCDSVRVQPL